VTASTRASERPPRGRSRHDREILRLALPALGALAAEPLYLLVDTAIVGHLGTPQLAALTLAAALLSTVTSLCIFLTYGTTAQVARLHGAGEDERAGTLAAQALWLALAVGTAVACLLVALADPVLALLGAEGRTAELAARYVRIAAPGLVFALIALAGQGYLRGVGDVRTPLVIVTAGNALNAALDVLFVYGFGWGLDGSAAGTVVAQTGMGAAFVWLLVRAPAATRRPRRALMWPLVRMSGELLVRSAALTGSFLVASAVVARFGEDALGAHQIGFQLYVFVALVLDAIAIAGQVIVGRMLGAGDADEAFAAARRMLELSIGGGVVLAVALLALGGILPRAFTGDAAVVARAHEIWPLLALLQPLAAAVYALDGILIGAGDTRFLAASMLVAGFGVYAPIALLSLALDWGIVGVWCGLVGLIVARLVQLAVRFRGRRWAVVGAWRAA
jgi:putative MATE family efflux protein